MSWLIVTEKQNAAERIAKILFKDVKSLKKGKISYYYSPSSDAFVIGLKGHVLELDFPKKFKNWTRTKLLELINADLIKEEKEKEIVSLLRELAKDAERVTIATDYDREGELIGVEALEIIAREDLKVERARFSAITKEEIIKAFNNPTRVDFNLANSALARQKIDLIWGAVLTRFISLSSGRLGKDFLSVGRVQTPTLRLIVEREMEIENFKPEKFYELFIELEGFTAKHPERYKEIERANEVLSKVGDHAIVREFKSTNRAEAKPIPFNTTEFLRSASIFMPPHMAMSIAENLYINGYISYPRTDNTVYPASINVVEIAKAFLNSDFAKEAKIVLNQKEITPSRGKKETTDHPPIYPTAVARREDLSPNEWKIYELVVRRFLATLAENAIWEIRSAELESNGVKFVAGGRKLVKAGWREIYNYSKAEEIHLPVLKIGEKLRIKEKRVEEKETKPPPRFSPATLIKLMEKLNLGTKSTRHEIIKKLLSRGYIDGNPYQPTQTAFSVIEVLKDKAETITLPEMTAKLEEEMDKIAEGSKSEEEVVLESRKMLYEILKSIGEERVAIKLKEGIRKDKVIGKCPKCGKDMLIRRSKAGKRFVGCSGYPECNFSLPLPQKGSIYVTAKNCKEHGIKILKIRSKKPWNFCPICNYNEFVKNNKKED
ncbi:MAG: DNA topoisomerase I [Archaeoglobaceae archaeon]|nr:DNA topoisomerase I [Archaeoglobaceae archaeon]MDW8117451.1 DNA topoisomerase I [Archaeoglobaceae archaeon]